MFELLKKYESVLLRLACIQFVFLIIAQMILYKKEIAPYVSKTIFSEGVFREYVYRTLETLDQLTTLWYYI